MKWIDFYYERPLVTKSQAIRNAKTLVANKQPVGVPALPLFNKAQYDLANTWIKPYINVPLGADEAVHDRHLRADADPGAGGVDAERVPLARRRRRRRCSPNKNANITQLLQTGEQRRAGR